MSLIIQISPARAGQINKNYLNAARRYEQKKNAILKRLEQEQKISGNKFIAAIEERYRNILNTKMRSPLTKRTVGMQTIMEHLYKAVQDSATQVLTKHKDTEIQKAIAGIKKQTQKSKQNAIQEEKQIAREIERIVQQYNEEVNVSALISEYLPTYISTDNAKLISAQIYGYTRSLLKHEVQVRAKSSQLERIFQKRPALLMGYIQEDAVANAALQLIDQIQTTTMTAATVGGERTKIDILISLTDKATSRMINENNTLSTILDQLDTMSKTIIVDGESYMSDEFIGIQSKPWNLYQQTTEWNRNSIGSRTDLFKAFSAKIRSPRNLNLQDRGALFLSSRLNEVLGENTVMYALKGRLIWTSDLLESLPIQYHKYFAFMLNANNELSEHVQLADAIVQNNK